MAIERDPGSDTEEESGADDADQGGGGVGPSIPELGGETRRWYRDRLGLVAVAAYVLMTGLTVAVVTGALFPTLTVVPGDGNATDPAQVPPYVLVYAFAGGLAYVFTSVLTEFDKTVRELLVTALRLPAALLLATGVYLLAALLFDVSLGPRLMAGVAFLVGLYVKLALVGLGGLARRLYGRAPARTES